MEHPFQATCKNICLFQLLVLTFYCRMNPVKVGVFTIYFRGIRILDTVIDALLMAGVNAADHVILTGCSGDLYIVFTVPHYIAIITSSWRLQHLRTRRSCT